MEETNLRDPNQPARYSRVLDKPKVFALGASMSIGIGLFGLFGFLLQAYSPAELKKPYIFLVILAIPLILTYVEKAVNLRGFNGIYEFLKSTNELWATFFGSWFMILGYVSIISISANVIGTYLHSFLTTYLDYSIDARLIILAVILLQTIGIFIRRGIKRSIRTSYILFALIALVVILLQGFFPAQPINFTRNIIGNEDLSFGLLALLMSSLWGLFYIFRERKAIIKPRQTILPVTIVLVVLIGTIGFLSMFVLDANNIQPQTLFPFSEFSTRFENLNSEVISLTYAFLVIGCAYYVLRKTYYDGVYFVNLMVHDGFLIKKDDNDSKEYFWLWPVIAFSLISSVMVMINTTLINIGLISASFFLVTIFVHIPDFFKARPKYAKSHYLKLPFHPLFPGLSTVIPFLLLFSLPKHVILIGIIYSVAGLLYYILVARKQAVLLRRDQILISDELLDDETQAHPYRVMVGIANPNTAPNLVETAVQIAKARNGEVLALRTISYTGEMSETSRRRKAQREYEVLEELLAPIDTGKIEIKPLVRLAAEPIEGILDTIVEEEINLLVIGWEDKEYNARSFMNTFMNEVLRKASCEVAIVNGEFPKRLRHISVPTAGGPYASMGLSLACDFAESEGGKVSLVNVIQGKLTDKKKEEANMRLQETRSVLLEQSDARVDARIIDGENIVKRLSREALRTDLFLIGASKEGALDRPYFGGFPVELAASIRTPIIITRGIESTQRFFLQRIWGALFDSLPSLNVTRRKEVMRTMRDAAKPTPDFFVLIVLASMIASLGLLQNSAAVIIGAMLVAPLMSPILAMGMSLVLGNIRQFYEATETAVKGIAVAILVGMLVSIVSPIDAATNEILARTSPNILDLLVAIASGAAAGYAMSRREVSAAMPGVAISAALVPPLCVIGYGLGTAQFDIASGSALLFITNLIAILLSAAVVFLALGFYPQRSNRSELLRTLRITLISLVAVTAILGISTVATVNQANREHRVNEAFSQFVAEYDIEILDFEMQRKENMYVIKTTIVENGEREISPEDVTALQNELKSAVNGEVSIDATVLSAMHLDTKFITQENTQQYLSILHQLQLQQYDFSDVSIVEEEGVIVIEANVITNQSVQDLQTSLLTLKTRLESDTSKPVEFHLNVIAGEVITIE